MALKSATKIRKKQDFINFPLMIGTRQLIDSSAYQSFFLVATKNFGVGLIDFAGVRNDPSDPNALAPLAG